MRVLLCSFDVDPIRNSPGQGLGSAPEAPKFSDEIIRKALGFQGPVTEKEQALLNIFNNPSVNRVDLESALRAAGWTQGAVDTMFAVNPTTNEYYFFNRQGFSDTNIRLDEFEKFVKDQIIRYETHNPGDTKAWYEYETFNIFPVKEPQKTQLIDTVNKIINEPSPGTQHSFKQYSELGEFFPENRINLNTNNVDFFMIKLINAYDAKHPVTPPAKSKYETYFLPAETGKPYRVFDMAKWDAFLNDKDLFPVRAAEAPRGDGVRPERRDEVVESADFDRIIEGMGTELNNAIIVHRRSAATNPEKKLASTKYVDWCIDNKIFGMLDSQKKQLFTEENYGSENEGELGLFDGTALIFNLYIGSLNSEDLENEDVLRKIEYMFNGLIAGAKDTQITNGLAQSIYTKGLKITEQNGIFIISKKEPLVFSAEFTLDQLYEYVEENKLAYLYGTADYDQTRVVVNRLLKVASQDVQEKIKELFSLEPDAFMGKYPVNTWDKLTYIVFLMSDEVELNRESMELVLFEEADSLEDDFEDTVDETSLAQQKIISDIREAHKKMVDDKVFDRIVNNQNLGLPARRAPLETYLRATQAAFSDKTEELFFSKENFPDLFDITQNFLNVYIDWGGTDIDMIVKIFNGLLAGGLSTENANEIKGLIRNNLSGAITILATGRIEKKQIAQGQPVDATRQADAIQSGPPIQTRPAGQQSSALASGAVTALPAGFKENGDTVVGAHGVTLHGNGTHFHIIDNGKLVSGGPFPYRNRQIEGPVINGMVLARGADAPNGDWTWTLVPASSSSAVTQRQEGTSRPVDPMVQKWEAAANTAFYGEITHRDRSRTEYRIIDGKVFYSEGGQYKESGTIVRNGDSYRIGNASYQVSSVNGTRRLVAVNTQLYGEENDTFELPAPDVNGLITLNNSEYSVGDDKILRRGDVAVNLPIGVKKVSIVKTNGSEANYVVRDGKLMRLSV